MTARKTQFALSPRRRGRWFTLCLGMAVACGILAGALGPKILVGGVPRGAGPAVEPVPTELTDGEPLGLAERLGLDPAEIVASETRWARLAQAEREVLIDRYRRLVQMDPADRDRLVERYAAIRQLSPQRQDQLRKRAAALAAFVQMLSPEDQALLESMNDYQRASRLLELWQVHDGD